MTILKQLQKEIESLKNPILANHLSRYFKTKKGEYAYGDIFIGINVPICRKLSKKYFLSLEDTITLLHSLEHEKRSIALFILIEHYKISENKKEIVDIYLSNTKYINNWDLVDCSSYKIIGNYMKKINNLQIASILSKSKNLWEKRIAITSLLSFTKEKQKKIEDIFNILSPLLKNEHDLINKAIGWLLRELFKKNPVEVELFLINNIIFFSNITLTYALEKLEKSKKFFFRSLRKKQLNNYLSAGREI